jgi:hypothetical protein
MSSTETVFFSEFFCFCLSVSLQRRSTFTRILGTISQKSVIFPQILSEIVYIVERSFRSPCLLMVWGLCLGHEARRHILHCGRYFWKNSVDVFSHWGFLCITDCVGVPGECRESRAFLWQVAVKSRMMADIRMCKLSVDTKLYKTLDVFFTRTCTVFSPAKRLCKLGK